MLNTMEERQQLIINMLKRRKVMSISDIAAAIHYSESTIKRDLLYLEKQGIIYRIRGGAVLVDSHSIELPYLMKISQFEEEKDKKNISYLASSLIKDDMSLFIDSSTTSLHLVKYINGFEGLKVITNGLVTAAMLSEFTDAQVNMLPGMVVSKHATINSLKTYQDILTYNVDLAFVSCRGFDMETGTSETTQGEAYIKQAFKKQSKRLVMMITTEKVQKKYMYRSLSLNDIDYLVTDHKFSVENLKKLKNENVTLLGG